MTGIDKIKEQIEHGTPIFQELFNWKDAQIKSFLQEFMEGKVDSHRHVTVDGRVTRTIIDEIPTQIEIAYYDCILITPLGIHFKPEHTHMMMQLIQPFDKYFTLPRRITSPYEMAAAYNDQDAN